MGTWRLCWRPQGRRRPEPQGRRRLPTPGGIPAPPRGDGDVEALLAADTDEEIYAAVATFRTDRWSRVKDGATKSAAAMMRSKAHISSLPEVVKMMTLAARCSFVYDFASDGQVGHSLITGGNLWWGCLVLLFMAIPYLVLLVILHEVAQKKLRALFGHRRRCITCVWFLFGIPALIFMDVYLNIRFCCTLPDDMHVGPMSFSGVELFHYMELRKIAEFAEGVGQLFLQGYISIRLWNPGDVLPHVGGFSVDPWMLLVSLAFSAKGVYEAVTEVRKLAKKQMKGNWVGFLKKMALLGEGLVPSVIYHQIEKHRAVVVTYDLESISMSEIRELGLTIRESSVLEELSFKSLEFLLRLEVAAADVQNFCSDVYRYTYLKRLEFGTEATSIPAWLLDAMLVFAENSLSLPHVMIGGKRHQWRNAAVLHDESALPLVRHALSGDDSAFRRTASDAGGADIPAKDIAMAIRVAAALGHVEVVRAALLLPLGLEALRAPGAAEDALRQSALRGQALCVSLLLCARADPDSADVVYEAAFSNQASTLELLLEARGDVDKTSSAGATPIVIAAQNDSVESMKLLLAARGDIDKPANDGATPMIMATQNDNVEPLKLLLAARSDIDKPMNDGTTPMFIAAEMDNVEPLKLLLAARGDADKPMNDGATPMFIAAQNDNVEPLKLLLAARGDVDKPKDSGATPMFIAAQNDNVEPLKLLLAARGDIDKPMNDGATPMFTAAQNDNVEPLKLLLAARGDIDKPMKDGCTPMFIAAQRDNVEPLKLLLAARGDIADCPRYISG